METLENVSGNFGKCLLEHGKHRKMYLEIGIAIWHWKMKMETLENSIENMGTFYCKYGLMKFNYGFSKMAWNCYPLFTTPTFSLKYILY